MASDALEAARARYTAAYDSYRQASARVAEKLANALVPPAKEIADEANALERLTAARRELLDVMTSLLPRRY